MKDSSQNPPLPPFFKGGREEGDRFCAHLPLPSYRYIPGKGPKDEHRQDIPKLKIETLPPDRWRENEAYLYGIDLYHHDYFYEAHEVWEELWHKVGHKTLEGNFLKALIQCAAVRLKIGQGETSAAERMSKRIQELLDDLAHSGACGPTGEFMGMMIPSLLKEFEERGRPPARLL